MTEPVVDVLSAPYADVEVAVMDYLDRLTTAQSYTSTPPDLQDVLPVLRVTRVGGADDALTDRPRVEVAAFHATRGQAWALAERVRQAMLDMRTAGGVLIDRVRTDVGPVEVQWADPGVRVFAATYRLDLRRPVAVAASV